MRIVPICLSALAITLAGCANDIPGPVTPGRGTEGTLFVANKRGASLSRIDIATGEETHRADTCPDPHELTVSPDEARVAVACYSGRTLEVYSTSDLSRERVIELGDDARVHSAIWLADGRLIAGAEGRGSLYEIENFGAGRDDLVEIGGGGPGPHLIVADAAGQRAWGTIIPTGEVVLYDLASDQEVARRRVGEDIEAIALSPDEQSLWVATNTYSIAYRLDPQTLEVEAQVDTGDVPIRLAMHPSGDWVVSSNYGSGDISVIDTASARVTRSIAVSGSQEAVQVTLIFGDDGERLYGAETGADTIAEIDFASGEVLRRFSAGAGGDGLAVID